MSDTIVIELTCLAPISILKVLISAEHVLLEKHEHYQKRSYRNRFYLADAQGKKLCSIPLQKGKNEQTPIDEVQISYDTDWPTVLTRLIRTGYASAPYFDFYFQEVEELLQSRIKTLWELNHALLNFLLDHVGFDGRLSYTESYVRDYNQSLISDLRDVYRPSQKDTTTKSYPQVFEDRLGFIPNLSGLDLLMNCGPEASLLLKV